MKLLSFICVMWRSPLSGCMGLMLAMGLLASGDMPGSAKQPTRATFTAILGVNGEARSYAVHGTKLPLLVSTAGVSVLDGSPTADGSTKQIRFLWEGTWRQAQEPFSAAHELLWHEASGAELRYYRSGENLEYDLHVPPGADPSSYRFSVDGVFRIWLDADGHLLADAGGRILRQRRPVAFQKGTRGREMVDCAFRVYPDGRVGFAVGSYDPHRRLVIDPILEAANVFGGNGPRAPGILAAAVGPDNSVYILGVRDGNTELAGEHGTPRLLAGDAPTHFLSRISADFSRVIFTSSFSLDVDISSFAAPAFLTIAPDGSVYITAVVRGAANDYGLTTGPYGFNNASEFLASEKVLVTRVSANGEGLLFRTAFGCTGHVRTTDVRLHPQGLAILASGRCYHFAPSSNSFSMDRRPGDLDTPKTVLAVVSADGASMPVFTLLAFDTRSGPASSIDVDAKGRIVMAGGIYGQPFPFPTLGERGGEGDQADGYVMRFSTDGSAVDSGVYFRDATPSLVRVRPDGDLVLQGIAAPQFQISPNAIYKPWNEPSTILWRMPETLSSIRWSTALFPYYSYPPNDSIVIGSDEKPVLFYPRIAVQASYPLTAGALFHRPDQFQTGYLYKLNADGSALEYGTYLLGDEYTRYAALIGANAESITTVDSPPPNRSSPITLPPLTVGQVKPEPEGIHLMRINLLDPTNCQVSVDPAYQQAGARQKEASFRVSAPPGCPWISDDKRSQRTPTPEFSRPTAGVGDGSIRVPLEDHTDGRDFRMDFVLVDDQRAEIERTPASCEWKSTEPSALRFPAAGGTQPVTLSLPFGCEWELELPANWATVKNSYGDPPDLWWGSEYRTLTVSVPANAYGERESTLSLAGIAVPIQQDAGNCNATVAPLERTFPPQGGEVRVQVQTSASGCAWQLQHSPAVEAAGAGAGSAELVLRLGRNPSNQPRQELVRVAGRQVLLHQEPGTCQASVQPARVDLTQALGFIVHAQASGQDCDWQTEIDVPWLRRDSTSLFPESGSAAISFAAKANFARETRVGTVRILGQVVEVRQAGLGAETTVGVHSPTPFTANGVSYDPGTVTFKEPRDSSLTLEASAEWKSGDYLFVHKGWGESRQRIRVYPMDRLSFNVSSQSEMFARVQLVVKGNTPNDGSRIEIRPRNISDRRDEPDGIYLRGSAEFRAIASASSRFVRWEGTRPPQYPERPIMSKSPSSPETVIAVFEPLVAQPTVQWSPSVQRLTTGTAFPWTRSRFLLESVDGVPLTVSSFSTQCDGLAQSPLSTVASSMQLPLHLDVLVSANAGLITKKTYYCAVRVDFAGGQIPGLRLPVVLGSGEWPSVSSAAEPRALRDAAGYKDSPLPAGGIGSLFGLGLARETAEAKTIPLLTKLSDVRLRLQSPGSTELEDLPLFYVSPTQINFLLPDRELFQAVIWVDREGDVATSFAISIQRGTASIFTANQDGRGVPAGFAVRVPAGTTTQLEQPLFRCPSDVIGGCLPQAVEMGAEGDVVFLVLYGLGFPDQQDGFEPVVTIDGERVRVAYSGRQGQYLGLSQLNVEVPRHLRGRGTVEVVVDSARGVSNAVQVAF